MQPKITRITFGFIHSTSTDITSSLSSSGPLLAIQAYSYAAWHGFYNHTATNVKQILIVMHIMEYTDQILHL